ncbi:hypothetical protein DZB84_02550 [Bacillus sp. HNG]|uniref:hypothetical protein n=1 Tax=Bacillus sp. HNG TaxID=2293325 RepID=UPI000E2F6609|nr:hypothetical protein [Bacillus sp. HNG]RFB19154.1 hypothetical protein DZB84_02550 [Bacillus sp. HNG]
MLSNQDMWTLFEEAYGFNHQNFDFEEVTTDPNIVTKRGLYISIEQEKRDKFLKQALYNGAVAAVWPKDEKLPLFLPNHFPVFVVTDPLPALNQILEFYLKKIEENGYDTMTKFKLFTNELKSMKQNDQAVNEITMHLRKLAMLEKGRG